MTRHDRTINPAPEWAQDALVQAAGLAAQQLPAPALYVVATPIGNAADITLRALWVLAHADAVAAEDTRTSRPLLARYGIRTPLYAAHAHNERAAASATLTRLAAGQRVALITDAGTPAVSDPGARLVRAVRAAGYRVVPVPGPSSALAALSASGAAEGGFRVLGFLAGGAAQRERSLRAAADEGQPFVLFEAPHRLAATAQLLARALDPACPVLVARELTKTFETLATLPAAALPDHVATHPPRGEYVLVIDAAAPAAASAADGPLDAATRRWLAALAGALPPAQAAAIAARATGLPRARLYAALAGRHGDTAAPEDGAPAD